MGIQFIFFDQSFCDRFLNFVTSHGIPGKTYKQEPEGFVVEIPDDLEESVFDLIEEEYNDIVEAQVMHANAEDEQAFQVLGISVTGVDGKPQLIRIKGALGRRLSKHFTPDEIHGLVTEIIDSYTAPTDAPLCHPSTAD
ncbi:MAG: hypothetical protein G3H99_02430 [Ferrovum sp.]|nr:hypothetical protein [Ferrovum sp.]NDU87292.1 hypothetical protein [Ferrovum sp.]